MARKGATKQKVRVASEEISEIRCRHLYNELIAEQSFRMRDIHEAFKKVRVEERELLRYFPVALAACLERTTRFAIKELIDAGEPFLSNAEAITNTFQSDFSILRAIHGKVITVGEFVAHGVRISNLGNISSAITAITGEALLEALKLTVDRVECELKQKPREPIIGDHKMVYEAVKRTFELRHIICHEMASGVEITHSEIEKCIGGCSQFLDAFTWYISETIKPNAPLTQMDMNIEAGHKLDQATVKLEALCAEISQDLHGGQLESFKVSQDKWLEYKGVWAKQGADEYEGGSIWPTIYVSIALGMTERRITELQAYLDGRKYLMG